MRGKLSCALLAGVLILCGPAAPSLLAAGGPHGRRASVPAASVAAALVSLEREGAITPASYQQDAATYLAARKSLAKLGGARHAELAAVLANVQAMAAAGELIASRLPAVFLTLERNQQFWTSQPLPAGGARLTFPGSKLVWQYYPGQGIEIQWLGTFGAANAYYAGRENANLRQLLSEALALASTRAGGIAWEYLFKFDGGAPPWTSGLSQGTAVQALARAWSRLKEPADLTAAQQALGVFQTAPPTGVRVDTAAGALYAEYSYAPRDRILNGFIQALVGLYDYAHITGDPLGLALFEAGDAEARMEVPRYDTGAWSLYDQFGESSLGYHELLTEFLEHLCERTSKGPPLSPPGAAAPAQAGPISADAIYCTTAQRFSADLHTPPLIALLTKHLRGGERAGVQFSLSKIATVQMTVRQGARVVWSTSATVERGKPRLPWVTPPAGGRFTIALAASDEAGNFTTTSGTLAVARG